jgi:hypothetical protein
MYKISSASIHSLNDEDTKEFISPIYEFIIHQLNYMKNQDDSKKKIAEAKRTLERCSSGIIKSD